MSSPFAQAATSCEQLKQVAIAGTELEQIERQEAGDYTAPDSSTLKDLPALCRVQGVIRPAPRSKTGCEAPERDQQLARHGHNGDPPCAPGQRADALAEPLRQLGRRSVALIPKPPRGLLARYAPSMISL